MEETVSLLINLYHHHQLPAGQPKLAERRNRCNQQAEVKLKLMEKHPAPHKPQTALEDLHHFVKQHNGLPWGKRAEVLNQRYLQNRFKEWPGEALILLALVFPPHIPKSQLNGQHYHNDVPRQKLNGKECYNLFKSLTAMLLHLEEEQLATA